MGAALSVSNATVINDAVNKTFQTSSNACAADCNQAISGVDIILNNSQVGNITFTQKCTADASCMMTNAVEQVVNAYQLAVAKAESVAPLLPIGIQVNLSSSSTENQIRNELTQVLENRCNATVNQNIGDILIYATNSTTGDIGYLQEGNANARCVMDNAARMQLTMSQKGEATATSGSAFGGLIGAIIALAIIVMVIGAIAKANKDKKANDAEAGGAQGGQQQKNGQFDVKRLASSYGGTSKTGGSGLTQAK